MWIVFTVSLEYAVANKGICFKWGDGHLKLSLTPTCVSILTYKDTYIACTQHIQKRTSRDLLSDIFNYLNFIWDQICAEGYPEGSLVYWQKKQGRRGGGGKLPSFPWPGWWTWARSPKKERRQQEGRVPLPFSSILYWPSVWSIYLCLNPWKCLKHERKPPSLFQRISDIKHCNHRHSRKGTVRSHEMPGLQVLWNNE